MYLGPNVTAKQTSFVSNTKTVVIHVGKMCNILLRHILHISINKTHVIQYIQGFKL